MSRQMALASYDCQAERLEGLSRETYYVVRATFLPHVGVKPDCAYGTLSIERESIIIAFVGLECHPRKSSIGLVIPLRNQSQEPLSIIDRPLLSPAKPSTKALEIQEKSVKNHAQACLTRTSVKDKGWWESG